MRREEIVREVENAFADCKYPRGDDVFRGDNIPFHPETIIAHKVFKNKNWQELDCDEILNDSLVLHLLSSCGACYFLPKIMICSLNENINPNIFGWIEMVLFYRDESEDSLKSYTEGILSRLSASQRTCLLNYLEYLSELPSSDQFFDVEDARRARGAIMQFYKIE